ncbi:von Willebrand factor A domain-containing protein 5A-like [Scyliorhinus canicula]|uniref:von Willebrand factor A domain-containing protein 5A-like n=1 Tax=Scyliorhinus canicula TaxID=7830 RepID=UPI0018F7BC4F|nr:von Willebrand factor A domain-containing protein 5A-like [Scyliorhinus canicula]
MKEEIICTKFLRPLALDCSNDLQAQDFHTMERTCGLLTAKNIPVPLRSISVEVEVKGFVADVSASLEYKNEETNPVEAVFVFPMDSDAAVYNFQAVVDGKTIVAKIKEKEQAKDEYDDAISAGHEAFLLEEDSSSSDIFTCTVGNLPPAQSASISFSFVQELAIEADGAVRFALPAVLNPRYTPTDQTSTEARILDRDPNILVYLKTMRKE